jgi:hypothetical protein
MSSLFLGEKLTFFGWLGCALCIVRPIPRVLCTPIINSSLDWIVNHRLEWQVGQVVVAVFRFSSLTDHSGPQEASVGEIREFQKLFLSPLFVVYISLVILGSLVIMFYFGPKSIFIRPS